MGFKTRSNSGSSYEVKTKRTSARADSYIQSLPDERRRMESDAIVEMMRELSGEAPAMWGDSIIGFGSYHYRTSSGCEADQVSSSFDSVCFASSPSRRRTSASS